MSLPTLRKYICASMTPVKKNTTDAAMEANIDMEAKEAMINIMQTVFTVLQSSIVLGEDTLSKGRRTFLGLLSLFVTDTVKVRPFFLCPG